MLARPDIMKAPERLASLVVLGLLLCGCTDPSPSDPAQVVIAQIDDHAYTLAEFQGYLDDNLVSEDDLDETGTEAAMVKSRLLDAFIDERLLLFEADTQNLTVSDLEVEAYLVMGGRVGEGDEASATRSDRQEARRRLKIEKLLEKTIKSLPPTELPAAAPSSTGPEADTQNPGRRLRLRSLMLETEEVAAKVSREISRGRITFDEAVVTHATSPEHGMPIELAWGSLSEEHRQGLEGLKAGQVSKPLTIGGDTYLFQIQALLDADSRDPETQAEKARQRAESVRRAETLRSLVTGLRERVSMRLFFDALPFDYLAEDSVD